MKNFLILYRWIVRWVNTCHAGPGGVLLAVPVMDDNLAVVSRSPPRAGVGTKTLGRPERFSRTWEVYGRSGHVVKYKFDIG